MSPQILTAVPVPAYCHTTMTTKPLSPVQWANCADAGWSQPVMGSNPTVQHIASSGGGFAAVVALVIIAVVIIIARRRGRGTVLRSAAG